MPALLVIDDSQATRERVAQAVRGAALFDRIVEACDGIEGLRHLMAEPFDLVLCDLELPGLDGEKLLRMKDRGPSGENLPFLFLTGSSSRERKLRLLEDGAVDLLEKPVETRELCARLRLHLKIKHLQDELVDKNRELEALSLTDELTGLSNRRALTMVLEKEIARAFRYGQAFSLLMADLDHFKRVNDTFGHPAGDRVLARTSQLLQEWLRGSDTGARYGGEELAVVLVHTEARGAREVAERWRQALEQETHRFEDGRETQVTLSIGAATWEPTLATPAQMIAAADRALYAAKQRGRNRVVHAHDLLEASATVVA